MKLLFWLLIIPILSSGQSFKQERESRKAFSKIADTCTFPKPFEFAFIDTVALDKHSIYSRAYQWFSLNVLNYNRGLQMQDSTLGKFVLPAIVSAYDRAYRYTIVLDAREGKYRITFLDFYKENDEPYQNRRIPIDTIENLKMVYFGPGTKHNYWQAEKLHLQKESETLFALVKEYIRKNDDF